uniref:Ribonuclease P protein subunit p29 n=4 Tax=Zeugodacus cucurbitae TaxID=28588 RepID=A0A0A1XQK4_ZEUCU
MDNRMRPLKELLRELIATMPRDDDDTDNINPEHITMLEGGGCRANRRDVWRPAGRSAGRKTSRKVTRPARRPPSLLPREEFCKLGLHTLPRKAITFQEAIKIHYLWRDYVRESLGLRPGDLIPSVSDKSYDPLNKVLMRTDLHGAKIEVMESKCETLKGMIGVVVLDTKNTFTLVGMDDRIRMVPKADSVFCIYLGNIQISFYGKSIMIRPAERSVKKVKNFIEPFDVE